VDICRCSRGSSGIHRPLISVGNDIHKSMKILLTM
jgi:hypothetical protein